jgi:stearoyl-CoA desaturase (Delta-9 desaturase)
VACGLSIMAGYHRLFAHRTYRAVAPVRWCLLLFGAASFQNSAAAWSADHRAHHADTDGEGDPHAIGRGF